MAKIMLMVLLVNALVLVCAILTTSVQANDYSSTTNLWLLDHENISPIPKASASSNLLGTEDRIGGLNVYVSGSRTSRKAVLMASDVFGYKVENLRKIADKVAASGFFAVVPDFFNGDPYTGNSSSQLAEWRTRHDAAKAAETAKPVVEALKKDLNMVSIGAAGFCFGAKVATELAKTDKIKGVVLLHPTDVNNVTDIGKVIQPIEILAGDKESPIRVATVKNFEQILKAKPEVPSFVKFFRGAVHGWTTRYDSNDPKAVKLANEAHQYMLKWLIKYVK